MPTASKVASGASGAGLNRRSSRLAAGLQTAGGLAAQVRGRRAGLQVIVGFGVSAVCLALALQAVSLADVVSALGSANYWLLLPACLAQAVVTVARAWRWRVLLGNEARVNELFWAHGIGALFTNLLPLRAGEPARVVVASHRSGLPLLQVGVSAVLERALDVLSIVVLFVLVLIHMPVSPQIQMGMWVLAGMLALGLVGAVAVLWRVDLAEAPVLGLARCLPSRIERRVLLHWRDLVRGLRVFGRPAVVGQALAWSALIWAVSVAGLWSIIEAFVPGAAAVEPALMMVVLSLGVSIPSSPGFLGVYQLFGQQALLAPFPERYAASVALSIALVANLMDLVLPSLVGVVGLFRLTVPIDSRDAD